MSEMAICPCCGSRVAPEAIFISLDTNQISVGWHDEPARLRPMAAVFMHSVVNAAPRSVPKQTIIEQLWGQNECDIPEKSLDVMLNQLRPRIAPLGLGIETVRGWHQAAYRLVRLQS